MLVKIHKSYRDVVAICDSELLGKKFEQGSLKIELNEFFNGEERSSKEIREIIEDMAKEDASFNFVGKESVALALSTGIVSKQGVKNIQGIPVALVLL